MSAAFVSIPRITSGEPADANGWMLSCGNARRYSAASGSLSGVYAVARRSTDGGGRDTVSARQPALAASSTAAAATRKIAQIDRFYQNVTERSNAGPVHGIMGQNRPEDCDKLRHLRSSATVPEFART